MKRKRCKCVWVHILLNLLVFSITVNARTFHRKTRSKFNHFISSHHFHHNRNNNVRFRREKELTVCDTCQMSLYDTPFYCPIKPDLPQCIFPTCPKICDDAGGDPRALKSIPPSPPKRTPFPHPVNLPRIPENLIRKFTPPPKPKPLSTGISGGDEDYFADKDEEVTIEQEKLVTYNPNTCEFPSPNLRRIRPGSKYIEYRPTNLTYQISDIHRIAAQYNLSLAEFRHPMEWYSVEKSSVMESVATYKMTEEQPRLFYVVGLSDESGEEPGKFRYKSDNTTPTFAVFDPRIYGRADEKCGVLTHLLGSDKRQYLTTRFWNCEKYMGDGLRVAHGLFMFPPGSLCYQRSEEECARLQLEQSGGDAVYHNTIEIGQTLQRFIYLYTDQRSWEDAFAVCEAKGLYLLDFDPQWGDALRTVEVIEHFLREAKLNPVTTFWTSGRFGKTYADGQFTWATTNTVFENQYKVESPPFAFSWWDNQKAMQNETEWSRRNKMKQPCVSVSVNPETGGERPKLNFKSWYCEFPMYILCYKQLTATDSLNNPIPKAKTASRTTPHPESCKKSPENQKPGNDSVPGGGLHKPKEEIDPFDEDTCTSKSLSVKRLTPKSKFVDYQPTDSSHSAQQIKDQCKKYGLIPAEIRTREDWDAIEKSGIGGVVSGEDGGGSDYFYVIGMDDSVEFGKLRYESGDELTFAFFHADGSSDIDNQCTMLTSVSVPGTGARGLMMEHVSCAEGLMSNEKIAYGLCMFPPTWSCFIDSTEEIAAAADQNKFTTIIPLGSTNNRSIFFNPVQRTREDALKFSQAANLSLLDFDSKWDDTIQLVNIFKDKLVKDGGFFHLTSFWTSGKLKGFYEDKTGTWESTGAQMDFSDKSSSFHWINLKRPHLSRIREGTIGSACIEATFDNLKLSTRLRPDYCNMPKYFLMYRINKKRRDPPGINHLGITVIETGPRQADPSRAVRRPVLSTTKAASNNIDMENASLAPKKRETSHLGLSENTDSEYDVDGIMEISKDIEDADYQIDKRTIPSTVQVSTNSSEYSDSDSGSISSSESEEETNNMIMKNSH